MKIPLKIPLDVDRNFQEVAPGVWAANAKTLQVSVSKQAFVAVAAKPNPSDWTRLTPADDTLIMALPGKPTLSVTGNRATYTYRQNLELWIEVLAERIRRTIVVKSRANLAHLPPLLRTAAQFPMPNLSPLQRTGKHIELRRNAQATLHLTTSDIRDSAAMPYLQPCHGCNPNHSCGHQPACAGYAKCGNTCPRGDSHPTRLTTRPEVLPTEQIALTNGELILSVNPDWLTSAARVFPIYINDDVTPASTSVTGNGGWATNTANLVDDNTATHAGNTCAAGGRVDTGYANNYATFDLGAAYTIDYFKVQATNGLCTTALTAADWYNFRMQYSVAGVVFSSFSPECLISVPVGQGPKAYMATQRTSNTVSAQAIECRYVRVALGGSNDGAYYGQNNLTSEIQIWATVIATGQPIQLRATAVPYARQWTGRRL